jgi:dephospho-CoA kinase
MARNHLEKHEAQARIDAQMPLQQKVDKADYVLENNGSIDKLIEKTKQLITELKIKP